MSVFVSVFPVQCGNEILVGTFLSTFATVSLMFFSIENINSLIAGIIFSYCFIIPFRF